MFFRFPNIFDGVGLGIVPSRLAGFDRADVRFAVGRSELYPAVVNE
jgi:hypothetical protein